MQSDNKVFELIGLRSRRGSTPYIPVGERGQFRYPIHVNAEILGEHIDLNRTPFLPYLPALLTRPQEAWLTFEQHKTTKKIALRLRLIRVVQADKKRGMVLVANAHAGHLEGWTFIPMSHWRDTNKRRRGMLLFTDEDD